MTPRKPSPLVETAARWAMLWRSDSHLGASRHLIRRRRSGEVALFRTRREARAAIETEYGYIRSQPDLKAEPHRWRMPLAVRVVVSYRVVPA